MKKVNKLKKYNLKHQYLKLEEEEIRDDLESYIKDFEKRFNKYYQNPNPNLEKKEVGVNEEMGEDHTKKEAEKKIERELKLEELKNRPDKLKKLYKKLASYTHPDKGGSNELFQKVNKSYESNNLMDLLNMAGLYELDYDVDDSDESILEKNLHEIEIEINRMKSTLAWAWGRGDTETKLNVLSEVEKQTGCKVDKKDLPPDLTNETLYLKDNLK
jgi:hypothetical protein